MASSDGRRQQVSACSRLRRPKRGPNSVVTVKWPHLSSSASNYLRVSWLCGSALPVTSLRGYRPSGASGSRFSGSLVRHFRDADNGSRAHETRLAFGEECWLYSVAGPTRLSTTFLFPFSRCWCYQRLSPPERWSYLPVLWVPKATCKSPTSRSICFCRVQKTQKRGCEREH